MRPVLQFLEYTFDAANVQLRRGTEVIALRPKALAVLAYLAERPGQLVTKQELLDAVWADTAVGEWVLTTNIKELRQALDDDPSQPHIIETVHRHGYRFVAEISRQSIGEGRGPTSWKPDARDHTSRGGIVGRATELAELETWLHRALTGERQVGFIVGEAGIGKTTLVDEFIKGLGVTGLEARGPNPSPPCLVARGQCIDQHGTDEPYLPVLAALGRLCTGPEGPRLVALLRRHAPAWLAQLPSLIEPDEAEALERRFVSGSRQRMLREMTAFIEVLPHPFVLVLEDLHWSDHATLDLVSTLAERRDPARVLLIGTYRPVEVAVRDHPLKSIHHELRAHDRCHDLWMPPLNESAVTEYLCARWPGLAAMETLAHRVHQYTDGNPLFLVNVANALAADGVIAEDENRWVLRGDVATLGVAVPPGLRQMIAAQNDRLSEPERDMLGAGSVIGRTFSAALVAAALDADLLIVEEGLARLAQRGQVVRAAGESRWPDATVAGAYQFTHALYEAVLRDHIPPALRCRLHARIGERLEIAYASRHADVAAELAFHFEAGGLPDRAVPYLEQAAERAVRLGAGREAVDLLGHGVALLDTLTPTAERTQRLIQLCIALGRALPGVRGFTPPEIELAYERARALSEQTDDRLSLIQALAGLASTYSARAKFERAADAAAGVTNLAKGMPFPLFEFASHFFNGVVRYHTRPLAEARQLFDAAVAIDDISLSAFSIDPRVAALCYLGMTLLHQGYPDQARARLREAAERSMAGGRFFDRANVVQMECIVSMVLRDYSTLATVAAETTALGSDHEIPVAVAIGTLGSGRCAVHDGNAERGLDLMRTGIDGYSASGHVVLLPLLLRTLADAQLESGEREAALLSIAEARALAESTGEQRNTAELERLEGEVRLARGEARAAARCVTRAIEVAQEQGARWWELRATTSLARMALRKGQSASFRRSARDALSRVLESFTEGDDTADVQEARRLLSRLG